MSRESPTWLLLRAVRARLDNPLRWTQGAEAAVGPGEQDERVLADNVRATCWCLSGAIEACAQNILLELRPGARTNALRLVSAAIAAGEFDSPLPGYEDEREAQCKWKHVIGFNDTEDRMHEDILVVLDAALAAEEAA